MSVKQGFGYFIVSSRTFHVNSVGYEAEFTLLFQFLKHETFIVYSTQF